MSEPSSSGRHLPYQPGLDGLRALAVLAVMAYHFGIRALRGGLFGVDLFFVLSGFLITTLLLREFHGADRIDFGGFYARRVRRLFPALMVILIAVTIYAQVTHPFPFIADEMRKDSFASLFYVANWWFAYADLSYFAQFGAPLPLRHVWSLAVEEQWYLVWPVVLLVLLRVSKRNLSVVLGVVVALALASAAWMSHLVEPFSDPSRAYYGTDTRAHTLLVGAGLAIVLHRWPVRRTGAVSRAVQVGGAGALVGCVWVFTSIEGFDQRLYRGGFLLFAIAGAFVVGGIMVDERGPLARLLSIPPLPWIGRLSYGLYLWHWPIAVWINPIQGRFSGFGLLAVRTGVSFAAATASYYLIERPIRTAAWQRLPRPRLATAAAMAVASAVLVAVIWLPVAPPKAAAVVDKRPAAPRPPDRPDDLKVLLVGDSVAWSLGWGLPKQDGLRVSTAAALGCGILPGRMINNGIIHIETGVPPCATERDRWTTAIASLHPDVVVFGYGAWEVYDHIFGTSAYRVYSDRYRKELASTLRDDLDFLRTKTSAPIVFLDAPCMSQPSYQLGEPPNPRNSAERVRWVNEVLDQVVSERSDSVTILRWSAFLCPGGKFQTQLDGVLLRPDGVHFDAESAPTAWRWLQPRLRDLVVESKETNAPAGGSGS
jgi:peptidoglycan/LPS O-acetylase OafA/YrhL